MKRREILRLENVSARYHGFPILKHFNMTVYEGESLGIVETNEVEPDVLIRLLTGELEPDSGKIAAGFYGNDEQRRVYVLGDSSSMISRMTIGENLFVVRKGRGLKRYNEKLVFAEAQRILDDFGVRLDAREPVYNLTKTERRAVEILKAYVQHARVVVLSELLMDYSVEDQMEYLRLQKALQAKGISFIIMDYNLDILMRSCERLMFLKYGYNLKTYEKNEFDLLNAVRLPNGSGCADGADEVKLNPGTDRKVIFRAENISGRFLHNLSFEVREGEIVSIYNLSKNKRTELIYFLLGRDAGYGGSFWYRGQEYVPKAIWAMKKEGINLLRMQLSVDHYIFSDLSVLDNICIGVIKKMSRASVLSRTMMKLAKKEFEQDYQKYGVSMEDGCRELDLTVKWKTYLCRLELQHPRFLICEEVFAIDDERITSMVEEFLYRMRKFGTAILLVSSNDRKLSEISDKMFQE